VRSGSDCTVSLQACCCRPALACQTDGESNVRGSCSSTMLFDEATTAIPTLTCKTFQKPLIELGLASADGFAKVLHFNTSTTCSCIVGVSLLDA